ncbi:MAG TPA: hypothetical protein VLF91_03100 [Candidatus Saccharimonadales bacterium]|nr:hypothetical protein [Candidatus Saccharimonadales bacterium]
MANPDVAKKDKKTHLKDLALLFAVPVSIAVIAAAAIYTPRLFAKPTYDFIYSICNDYNCGSYSVDAEGYVTQDYSKDANADTTAHNPDLRYYTAASDSTRSITLSEAQRYQLNTSSKSPDGYTLTHETSSSGFLFWGNYDDGWFLKNGAKKKRVDLATSSSYYSPDIIFLGWITR